MLPAGVVPACAALDCLTVFARSVSDGTAIMKVMESADAGPLDVWRRQRLTLPGLPQQGFRFGVPSEQFTEWDGPGKDFLPVVLKRVVGLYYSRPCLVCCWCMQGCYTAV